MTFEEALRAKIIALPPVATKLAAWRGSRAVHWDERPEGAPLPCIVLTIIDMGRDHVHGGVDSLGITDVQADCLTEDPAAAKSLALALTPAVEAPATVDGILFGWSLQYLERTIPTRGVEGGQTVFGRTLRFSVYHKEQN